MIGENIKKLRGESKLTQEELAKELCVSDKTISSWENNRNLPDVNMLIKLSEIFNTDINTILGNNKEVTNMYEEKKFKDNIVKVIIIGLIFIIPFIYFCYACYTTNAGFASSLLVGEEITDDLIRATYATSLALISWFAILYIVYLLLMFINYILYNKKKYKILFILNAAFAIFIVFDIINSGLIEDLDLLLILFANIIGIIWGIQTFKNSLN